MSNKFVFSKRLKRGDLCPDCKSENQHTIDSRVVGGHRVRRRQCQQCGCKWNTIETFYNYVKGAQNDRKRED